MSGDKPPIPSTCFQGVDKENFAFFTIGSEPFVEHAPENTELTADSEV
jgi:hypothetical protein